MNMAKTKHQALCDAFTARGERRIVRPNVTKWTIFSRTWMGLRGPTGELVPAASTELVWYVSRGGSLRQGLTVGDAIRVKEIVRDRLLVEGGYVRPVDR
jgi:hypothetical protein